MHYVIILYTCLATGGDCRPHIESENLNLGACMTMGMQAMAKYQMEHPKRKPMAYKCTDRPQKYLNHDQA